MRNLNHKIPVRCKTLLLLAFANFVVLPSAMAQEAARIEDHYWICAYDFKTAKSQRLFALPGLNSVGSVSQSSDEKWIAFDGAVPGRHSTSDSHIFVCRPDGRDMKDLGLGTMPSWSPRGKRIAFSRFSPEHGVWTMNSDGSNGQLLDNRGWCAQWSPNGNMILYSRTLHGADDFVVFNLVEDEITAVFGDGSSGFSSLHWNFAWSPDSRRVCFKGTSKRTDIGIIDISSPKKLQTFPLKRLVNPDFTWLNNTVIVTSLRPNNSKSLQLCTLDTSAQKPTPVPIEGQFADRSNSDPDVSRDGRRMLYVSRKPPK